MQARSSEVVEWVQCRYKGSDLTRKQPSNKGKVSEPDIRKSVRASDQRRDSLQYSGKTNEGCPTSSTRRSLTNEGSTCFINVAIHAIRSIRPLFDQLSSPCVEGLDGIHEVRLRLRDVLLQLRETGPQGIDTSKLVLALRAKLGTQFPQARQGDAEEFLNSLLALLGIGPQGTLYASSATDVSEKLVVTSIIEDRCSDCDKSPSRLHQKIEEDSTIFLKLGTRSSLEELMGDYFGQEQLTANCDLNLMHQSRHIRRSLLGLPEYLVISYKATQFDETGASVKHASVPTMTCLDLGHVFLY